MPPATDTVASTGSDERLYPMLVRLPRDLHKEVKDRAAHEDRTLAQVVRRALKQYLQRGPEA
jgi:hypothetical protein